MRHFLFEDKEYKISVNFRKGGKIPESASSLNRLIRRMAGKSRSGAPAFKSRGAASDTRQRCATKMQYSTSMAAHKIQIEKYLVREGTDKDGNAAELYGTDIGEYKKNMVDKNFRVFLSPENGNIDLTALTKSFVKRLELDTGYKIYWEAANHYNTAHPHAHLIINGKDQSGRELEFSRDFVKTFMRENARNICTAMIGARSMEEIALEKEAALTSNRKIAFDERIKERMKGTFYVDLDGIKDKSCYVKRLDHFKKIGLAEFVDGKYKLNHKWEDTLSTSGRYNCFLNARDSLKFTDKSKLQVFDSDLKYKKAQLIQKLPEAEREAYKKEIELVKSGSKDLDAKERGKAVYDVDKKYGVNVLNEVVKKGVVSKVYAVGEEDSKSHAVLLEGIDGRAYFIPLLDKPDVKEGQFVRVAPGKSRAGRLTPVFTPAKEKHLVTEAKERGYDNKVTRFTERTEQTNRVEKWKARVMEKVTERRRLFEIARPYIQFTGKSSLQDFSCDFNAAKLRLVKALPAGRREAYEKESAAVAAAYGMPEADKAEKNKALYALDKKYGINTFNELTKKGVVSGRFTVEKKDYAVLESIDGAAYLVPLNGQKAVSGRFVSVTPKMVGGRLEPALTEVTKRELLREIKRNGYENAAAQSVKAREREGLER
jgi:hypothetical protein